MENLLHALGCSTTHVITGRAASPATARNLDCRLKFPPVDLIEAIQANNLREVERLLQAGADPNARRDKRHALDWVPQRSDAIRCALIEAGAWQSDLITSMVWAVTTGRPATVQALIDRGADLNKAAPMGTPLEVSARFGHFEIVEKLLRAGADPQHGDPVPNAIANGHPAIALLLLAHGAAPQGLETAAWLGQIEVVQQLLQQQAAVNQVHAYHRTIPLKDFTALHCAALAGQQQVLDLLLAAGASPGLRDGQGRLARELGGPELQNLEAPPDLDHQLQQAIASDQAEVVRRLLSQGASPNQRDQRRATRGYTPLMLAAAAGHLDILEILLEQGAELDGADADSPREGLQRFAQFAGKEQLSGDPLGHTALFAAARHGQTAALERLLQAGADPNRRDFLQETPLIWAAEGGHLQALRALLQSGSQPDPKALLAALEASHPECALELLEGGTPPDQKALVQAAYLADARILRKMLAVKPRLKAGKALAPIGYATRLVPADQAPPGRWTTIFNEKGSYKRVPEPEDKILEAAEVLLQAGAPVNEVSPVGPALYVAASQGLTRLVQRLLAAGADPALGHRDSTPLEIANLMGHEATASLLQTTHSPAAPPLAPAPPKALKQPRFKNMPAVPELEKICGSPSTLPDYLRGGREIHLRHQVDLTALQRQWRPHGLYLFHPGSPDSLAVIPANHWRTAIAVMQTNGANSDLYAADIVKWLEELEKNQPFELSTIAHDRLEGVFLTPIAEPMKLARKMVKFCSDIVDQGCGSVEILAQELQRQPARLYFWWD